MILGDLTDGKYDDGVRTNQFEEEWIDYRKALQDSGVVDKTLWLDMRGMFYLNIEHLTNQHFN